MRTRTVLIAAVAAAAVAGGAAAVAAAAGGGSGPPAAFAWFRAGSPPPGWHQVTLTNAAGVLSYPPTLQPLRGDVGSVSAAQTDTAGFVTVYLNATPRQAGETLAGWAESRLEHLTDENHSPAHRDATASGLHFRGGTGSCVIDDYVTAVHPVHYQEIACFVQGRSTASVVVAATRLGDWARYRNLLEQAVSSYQVR